ncbi:MAG: hypothetical protein GQ569_13890 [Methylococcaceae bacterium]|nr:hypothetical protein [Methylococcaceae bacterium]
MISWHRLFGIFLSDYFTDTPYSVELEKDVSVQQQFLDVVILHKEQGEFQGTLPDGLDNLSTHNLLSYKSMRESFDFWAVQELIGHYVSYRKQISKPLLAESEFSLYAVSTCYPQKLAKQVTLTELSQGVYQLKEFGNIRLIVLTQIPKAKHNAVWHLFSHNIDKIKFGINSYHSKIPISTIVNVLYEHYQTEELIMPYTLDDFNKEIGRKHLHFLNVEDVAKEFPIDEYLKHYSTDEVLKQYSLSERMKGLPKEEVEAYFLQLEQQKTDNQH